MASGYLSTRCHVTILEKASTNQLMLYQVLCFNCLSSKMLKNDKVDLCNQEIGFTD